MNDEESALRLGTNHTNKIINDELTTNPFLLTHNSTDGVIADLTECALEKLAGQSNASKQITSLMAKRAELNMDTFWIMHSQGTLMETSALRSLHQDYGVNNWSNLKVRYHGSPTNYMTARYQARKVGAKWGGMKNHPGDAVGIVLGMNTVSKIIATYAILKSPSLFFDVRKHPTGYLNSKHTIYHNE